MALVNRLIMTCPILPRSPKTVVPVLPFLTIVCFSVVRCTSSIVSSTSSSNEKYSSRNCSFLPSIFVTSTKSAISAVNLSICASIFDSRTTNFSLPSLASLFCTTCKNALMLVTGVFNSWLAMLINSSLCWSAFLSASSARLRSVISIETPGYLQPVAGYLQIVSARSHSSNALNHRGV